MTLTWSPHIRLSFGGEIGNPAVEQWSNTVRFRNFGQNTGDPSSTELEGFAAAAWARLSLWFNSNTSGITNQSFLTWIKCNWILASGKQRDQNTVIYDAGRVAGGSGGTVPWYQTLALTERTEFTRGRAAAGRIFPPTMLAPCENAGTPYIAASLASQYASAWATVLGQLNADFTRTENGGTDPDGVELPDFQTYWSAAIVSPGNDQPPKGGPTTPLAMPIVAVVADRVADVQHRRTRQVARSEGTSAVVPAHP